MFISVAIMAAFTLGPPAHQTPESNRFVPEVVYQKPPLATITLSIADTSIVKGGEACVAVTAKGFRQILTMQYSMAWDPGVLKLKGVRDFGLAGMDNRNFGFHISDKGVLTFSWYDHALLGVTKDNGFRLYQMCFDAIGDAGSETTIEITSKPTVIEIANASSVFLDLRTETGKVKIE